MLKGLLPPISTKYNYVYVGFWVISNGSILYFIAYEWVMHSQTGKREWEDCLPCGFTAGSAELCIDL